MACDSGALLELDIRTRARTRFLLYSESVSEWAVSRSQASTLLTEHSARGLSRKEAGNASLPGGFAGAFGHITETLPIFFRW
jgi:hypothetical protein